MSNTITVEGNLGKDATLKFTKSGAAVLKLSVPDTPRRKVGDQWEDAGPTTWFNVDVWGQQAEALANSGALVKGTRVTVTGTLAPRAYEKDGQQRVAFDVKAKTVGFEPPRTFNRPSAPAAADPWGAGVTSDAAPF